MLVLALANPQIGTRLEEVKQEGVDIFIALDVSLSMKAEDIKPNRLEKAKLEIRNLIGRLGGDRIGLDRLRGRSVHAVSADHRLQRGEPVPGCRSTWMRSPRPGTAIGAAIERAMESFDFKEPTTKVLVIITDGENTEGDVFDAGGGSGGEGGADLHDRHGFADGCADPGLQRMRDRQVDFKRDRSGRGRGHRSWTKRRSRSIAAIGNGKYFRGTTSQDELDEIYKDVNALQKKEFGVKQFTDYEDRFQCFLFPASAAPDPGTAPVGEQDPVVVAWTSAAARGGGEAHETSIIVLTCASCLVSVCRCRCHGAVRPLAGERRERSVS